KPNMDETRFASTQVLRALHDDFEKARTGAKPGDTNADLTRAVVGTEAETPKSGGWLVPAIAAVVVVAAGGGYMLMRSAPPPETSIASNAPPATDAAAKPAPETAPPATTT